MDDRMLNALKGSIKKWEDIVDGVGEDEGADNCLLCMEFREDRCSNCPVKERTGGSGCIASPYTSWERHHHEVHGKSRGGDKGIMCDTCADLAQDELDFLKSLLPEEEFWKDAMIKVFRETVQGCGDKLKDLSWFHKIP